MFERFTERARQVVVLAQKEARTLLHDHIGTEHFLLGLLREQEGIAARVLRSLDITLEPVRAQVVHLVGAGEAGALAQIPFTPRAKMVLELALREALTLGHNYIGTEHLLLGLVRENEGVATRVLLDFGADADRIRDEVIRMLRGPGAGSHQTPAAPKQLRRSALPHTATDDGAAWLLDIVAPQIKQQLGRPADAGDLLVALASVPDGLAARTLAGLGIDEAALARAVAEARGDQISSDLSELEADIKMLREQKEASIETRDFHAAADLRKRQRRLADRARELDPPFAEQRLDRALIELRNRLRLPGS